MVDLPDITRLRAALDVALTTLDTCSRPSSPAADAPGHHQKERSFSKDVTRTTGTVLKEPADEAAPAPVNVELRQANMKDTSPEHKAMIERVNRQDARIKELEEHILRKSVEEVETSRRTLELDAKLKESQTRILEYEEKLEQALPLLQTLDQSRVQAREAKRRAQITADELSALTCDHQVLAAELAKSRQELSAAQQAEKEAAAQLSTVSERLEAENAALHKQLQDEREESAWLQQVAARQAKEMERSLASLQATVEQHKAASEASAGLQQEIEQLRDSLKQRDSAATAQQQQVALVLGQMQAGNQGLAEEVLQLQKQLNAVKDSKPNPTT